MRGNPHCRYPGAVLAGSIPACAGKPRTLPSRVLVSSVYPRVCGETVWTFGSHSLARGLSPRVRGNRVAAGALALGDGSIPACAGKPSTFPFGHTLHTVYPRVCGETIAAADAKSKSGGLSPRVRGNLWVCERVGASSGSIPACAGKPSMRSRRGSPSRVYPRVCGETEYEVKEGQSIQGLSPRVRGNPDIGSHSIG